MWNSNFRGSFFLKNVVYGFVNEFFVIFPSQGIPLIWDDILVSLNFVCRCDM